VSTAILFPGQASQTPDMRDLVADVRPDLLALAADVVGEDPFARVDDGTDFAQPALFCASLAASPPSMSGPTPWPGTRSGSWRRARGRGALSEEDGLSLVALRGRLMQEAGESSGPGACWPCSARGDVAGLARRHGVTVAANDNAPGQLVLSGDRDALKAVASRCGGRRLEDHGARRGGAFHSRPTWSRRPRSSPARSMRLRSANPGSLVSRA
jgi:acyl transferase domain-containing protein